MGELLHEALQIFAIFCGSFVLLSLLGLLAYLWSSRDLLRRVNSDR